MRKKQVMPSPPPKKPAIDPAQPKQKINLTHFLNSLETFQKNIEPQTWSNKMNLKSSINFQELENYMKKDKNFSKIDSYVKEGLIITMNKIINSIPDKSTLYSGVMDHTNAKYIIAQAQKYLTALQTTNPKSSNTQS